MVCSTHHHHSPGIKDPGAHVDVAEGAHHGEARPVETCREVLLRNQLIKLDVADGKAVAPERRAVPQRGVERVVGETDRRCVCTDKRFGISDIFKEAFFN